MLQIRHLTITHLKDLKDLVSDLSLTVNAGDKVGIIGEEGNGKSTLLKLLMNDTLVSDYVSYRGKIQKSYSHYAYLPQTLLENERKLLIFITMDNLSEKADYSNEFYDSQTFSWFSKSSRYLRKDNKLTIEGKIAENFYEINVFVKKNNGENFYYLGDVEKVLSAKEIKDSQGKSMVKYIFKLKKDVKKELLDYFNM